MAEEHKIHDGKREEKANSSDKSNENSKIAAKAVNKKNEATVNGRDLSVGLKHAAAICNMIRGKDIDVAISMLEEVMKYKRAIPMRGEIPHRHGMMSGRYPIKATGVYIKLLKSLKSNAIQHELELEKFKIFAMPNVAPRPYRKFGAGRFKRSHVVLKLIPIVKNKTEETKK